MKAKIYTKTGDKGETSLVGGERVKKTHPRLTAYGTLDELNSTIGLLRCEIPGDFPAVTQKTLEAIQNNIFNMGSHLACTDADMKKHLPGLNVGLIGELEKQMDAWEGQLPALKEFILPGGTRAASFAHLARTVCRRSEREILAVSGGGAAAGSDEIVFINRLSDWFFLLARALNAYAGKGDVTWKKG